MAEGKVQTSDKKSLLEQTVSSTGWGFLNQALGVLVQFIIGVVLARILPPEDFGLLGLAMIVVGFGSLFVKLGLGPAIIQRQDLTERHVRVAFTVSAIAGGVLCGALIVGAPLASWVLEDTRVTPILQVLSITFLIGGLQVPSQALLQKRLNFRRIFYISISKNVTYGVVSIALAVSGFGVWSLVYGNITQRVVNLVLNYTSVRHSLKPLLALEELKNLVSFGAGMSMASIFNYVALQGDYFVVGRVLGAHSLGLYTRAYSLMQMPTQRFVSVLSNVLFPAASRIQDDERRFQLAYTRTLRLIAFVTLPVMILLIVVAPELIIGIYGEKWAGAIVPLQILGAFGAFRALYNGAASFLRAKGWVYRILLCQVIYGTVLFVSTWFAATYIGLWGAALTVGVSVQIMWLLIMHYGAKAANLRVSEVMKTLWPGVIVGLLLGVVAFTVRLVMMSLLNHPLLILLATVSISFIAFTLMILYMPQHIINYIPYDILKSIESSVPHKYNKTYCRLCSHFRPDQHVIAS